MRTLSAAAAAALILAGCAAHTNAPKTARVGQRAPQWTLPTASGSRLSMSAFAGKPVYLNFFATWCPPCNAEAPDVNELQKKYASSDLRVVGIDELESAKQAQSFVKKYGLVYPAVVDDGTLEGAYLVNGLPVHVFIARDGTIKKIFAGEMNKAQIEASIRAVL